MPDKKKTTPNAPDDGKAPGKSETPDDNAGKDQEAIKGLQRVISDKDKRIKELEEKTNATATPPSEIEALKDQVLKLTEVVKNGQEALQAKDLQIKYPDVPPYLLVGKTEEEQTRIVSDIRARAQSTYGDSDFFVKKAILTVDELDAEIDRVKSDKTIDLDARLLRVRELERQKTEFKT